MAATFATTRLCPYCGAKILLADCQTVATNFPGVEFRDQIELDEIELPSGSKPIALLEKTRWPVVALSPNDRQHEAAEPPRQLSAIEKAFGGGSRKSVAPTLPPLVGDGVHYEDVPSRACYECEYPLPPDIDERPAVVVAIVGVNGVGKTHLLAASLTEAYARRGLAPLGCTEFVPSEVSSTRFMVDYNHPLFRRNEVLAATQAEAATRFEPLVFNVTLADGHPFSLVVHDIAGEVLGDYRRRAEAATFLRAARGIIFVVDPRDIDMLRDQLPDWILENDQTGFDQGALLAGCLKTDGIPDDRLIPVAITIAKADLLQLACDEELPFMAPAQTASEGWDVFFDRVTDSSRQVAGFLERYGAHNLLAPARKYADHCKTTRQNAAAENRKKIGTVTYHAVSALGSAPDAYDQLPGKVRPVNCVDPLAVVLAQIAQLW